MPAPGPVYLVGAGPGDPGLITLRGAELLRRADVVIYDALVNPALLGLARPEAERIYGGKRSKQHRLLQEDLNALLVKLARQGKTVVRLKGGDPYTFGRGGEEAQALSGAGISFETVPGISSAVAAPNYAGIPLTHREHSSIVTLITGHDDPDHDEPKIDWPHLARTPGTKVVLMGLKQIRRIAVRLVESGMDPATPVAMIRWGTTPRQHSIQGTLADIADRVEQTGFGAPAITVIGEVVRMRSELNWFERRPLFGQRFVVTRARDQAADLTAPLAALGADVLEVPVLKFAPPAERTPIVEAIAGLNGYDWLVFTSANGVQAFFNFFFKAFADLRDLGGVRIAAVGPATAARLRELHLHVDLVPEEYVAARIADGLARQGSLENLRVLLLRAEVAAPELPRLLEEKGAIVDDVAVYETQMEKEDANGDAARLQETGAEWVLFTSGSTARHFHQRFDLKGLRERFPGLKLATIGPETTRALETLGFKADLEASPHTTPGLITALLAANPKE